MVLETTTPALVPRLTAAAAACLLLTACGGGGGSASESKEDQPILTEKSVTEAWKSYDERNNAAMPKAGPPTYDGMAYATADIGPLLEQDVVLAQVDEDAKDVSLSSLVRDDGVWKQEMDPYLE